MDQVLRTSAITPSIAASAINIQALSIGALAPGWMGAVDVLVLFAGLGSVVLLVTVAVFDSVPAVVTVGAPVTIEIGGAAPAGRDGAVQVTTPATLLQVQPLPVALTKLEPARAAYDRRAG